MLYLCNLCLKTNKLSCHRIAEGVGDASLGNTSKKCTPDPAFQVIWVEKVF